MSALPPLVFIEPASGEDGFAQYLSERIKQAITEQAEAEGYRAVFVRAALGGLCTQADKDAPDA